MCMLLYSNSDMDDISPQNFRVVCRFVLMIMKDHSNLEREGDQLVSAHRMVIGGL